MEEDFDSVGTPEVPMSWVALRRHIAMIYKGFVDFSPGGDNRAMYWSRARNVANTGIGLMNPVVLDAHFARGVTRVPKGALLVRQNVCAQLTDTVEVDTVQKHFFFFRHSDEVRELQGTLWFVKLHDEAARQSMIRRGLLRFFPDPEVDVTTRTVLEVPAELRPFAGSPAAAQPIVLDEDDEEPNEDQPLSHLSTPGGSKRKASPIKKEKKEKKKKTTREAGIPFFVRAAIERDLHALGLYTSFSVDRIRDADSQEKARLFFKATTSVDMQSAPALSGLPAAKSFCPEGGWISGLLDGKTKVCDRDLTAHIIGVEFISKESMWGDKSRKNNHLTVACNRDIFHQEIDLEEAGDEEQACVKCSEGAHVSEWNTWPKSEPSPPWERSTTVSTGMLGRWRLMMKDTLEDKLPRVLQLKTTLPMPSRPGASFEMRLLPAAKAIGTGSAAAVPAAFSGL